MLLREILLLHNLFERVRRIAKVAIGTTFDTRRSRGDGTVGL